MTEFTQEELAEMASNVIHFGAAGDQLTDDTAAIQVALDAVGADATSVGGLEEAARRRSHRSPLYLRLVMPLLRRPALYAVIGPHPYRRVRDCVRNGGRWSERRQVREQLPKPKGK